MLKSNAEIEEMIKNDVALYPSPELKKDLLISASKIVPQPKEKRARIISVDLVRKASLIAAAFILVMSTVLSMFLAFGSDYGSVYIDINPSLELVISRNDRVKRVVYHNRDAKRIFSDLSLQGMEIDDAINEVLDKLEEENYLENEAEICISASTIRNRNTEKLLSESIAMAQAHLTLIGSEASLISSLITIEDIINAQGTGISPPKYKIIKQIEEIDDSYTLDFLEDLNIKALKNIYDILGGND